MASKDPQRLTEEERARHPHWRRSTAAYRRKRRIVRDVWIGSGLAMLLLPFKVLVPLLLFTTFISFAILDETG